MSPRHFTGTWHAVACFWNGLLKRSLNRYHIYPLVISHNYDLNLNHHVSCENSQTFHGHVQVRNLLVSHFQRVSILSRSYHGYLPWPLWHDQQRSSADACRCCSENHCGVYDYLWLSMIIYDDLWWSMMYYLCKVFWYRLFFKTFTWWNSWCAVLAWCHLAPNHVQRLVLQYCGRPRECHREGRAVCRWWSFSGKP